MKKNMQKAVVLLSGGMDSCVCGALAVRDHHSAALHVSYGQRTEEREKRAFLEICDHLAIRERLMVRNEALRTIGGSALTEKNISVPEAHEIGRDIPERSVAVRNEDCLAVAVGGAEGSDGEMND